jgi:hypothetical protein
MIGASADGPRVVLETRSLWSLRFRRRVLVLAVVLSLSVAGVVAIGWLPRISASHRQAGVARRVAGGCARGPTSTPKRGPAAIRPPLSQMCAPVGAGR